MLQQSKRSRIELNLNGPEGNVFVLIKTGMDLGFRMGMDRKEVEASLKGEQSRLQWSYEHTVAMFEHHFGDFYDIHGNPELLESVHHCLEAIRSEVKQRTCLNEAISIVL